MRRLGFALLLVVVLLALIAPISKAMMVRLTYEQLWVDSDTIALGKVTGSTNHADGGTAYQLREVAIERYYKGERGQTLIVKELGGDLGGGISEWVEDQPELSVGITYLLFLEEGGNGYSYVVGGPQGAMPVRDGVAEGLMATLRVTDSGLVPVQAESVIVTGFQNRTRAIVNMPAEMEIDCVNAGTMGGFWTFNVTFEGISGEAAGVISEQNVSEFVGMTGPDHPFPAVFYHNFTAPGRYKVSVDGSRFGLVNVAGPSSQLSLSWADFSSEMIFMSDVLFEDVPITMYVGPIPSNQTGDYLAVAVISPLTEGIEPFYTSWSPYPRESNWFTFHFVVEEPGDYMVTVWQGGVKQLTQNMTVGAFSSTGGGVLLDPGTAAQAAEAAERTARQANSTQADRDSTPAQSGSARSSSWLVLSIVAVLALTEWFILRVVRR